MSAEETYESLQALDPTEYINMLPKRRAIIEAASTAPLPKEYSLNQLAKTLHPNIQYLKVEKVVEHADAKSFELVPDPSRGTEACAWFDAGQYLGVHLAIGNTKTTKPYSLSSSPQQAREGSYAITVKHTEDGFASKYILEQWKEGTLVETSAPVGEFRYEPLRDAKHIIGLAGGSGITPFYSLAQAIVDGDEECSLTLLYGSRNSNSILFKEEFEELEKQSDKIRVIHVLSHETAEGFEQGFLTKELIEQYAPQEEYSLFVCGPQVMYEFVDKEIEKLGIARKWIRHELFGAYKNPEKNADYPLETTEQSFELAVVIRGEKQVIPAAANETLLVAMERAGIDAPSRCRSGECGFCHSKLLDGEVYVPASVDGRRLADITFGFIHPCCTFPIANTAIEVATENL